MSDPRFIVTFAVPAYPSLEQQQVLLQHSLSQDRMRLAYWQHVRALLSGRHAREWSKPQPQPFDFLRDLLIPPDRDETDASRSYEEQAIRDEGVRLKALPALVMPEDLQPILSLDRLTLPGLPFCPTDSQLILPDTSAVAVDAFALPNPFPAVLVAQGTKRLAGWDTHLRADYATWIAGGGALPDTVAAKILRRQAQYGPWCTGSLPQAEPVPGITPRRAALGRRLDRLGQWRWACWLRFELTSAARDTWFPPASSADIVGVDPGEAHPLTWATADADETLPIRLRDRLDAGSEARRVAWNQHQADYHRAWKALLQHKLIHVEDTHWHTLVKDNPDYIRRAHDSYLWSWLDHLEALAALSGARVEWVPARLTSRTCSRSGCHWVAPERQRGRWFTCGRCKLRIMADVNAARNIRRFRFKHA